MLTVSILAYIADAAVLVTYALLGSKGGRPFNWANFLGAWPIGAVELVTHSYQALVLTAAFGLIGLKGLLTRVA